MTHRAGFVAFVGRPNAGKSTLTHALVGEKVVITSSKPQTTRRVVRGIVHRPDAQLILVDTPGLHRPRTLLGERLNAEVRSAWSEVDVVGFCVPADERTRMAVLPRHLMQSMAGDHFDRPKLPYRMPYRYGSSARLYRPGWSLNRSRPQRRKPREQ